MNLLQSLLKLTNQIKYLNFEELFVLFKKHPCLLIKIFFNLFAVLRPSFIFYKLYNNYIQLKKGALAKPSFFLLG